MELYKRLPANGYKELAGYHRSDFCSNCGQNEYEDAMRSIATRKRRTRRYEKHCPSCHCPPERRRSPSGRSPSGGPRTLENVEATLNRYERVLTEPISSAIKKSQSSPLSQKVYWPDCQTGAHSRCPRRSLQQARRQRRTEYDRYLCRMKGDTVNSELINDDVEACSKYAQSVPIKSSLKRHNHCREPEGSPDEQEYSDAESEISTKYAPCIRQSKKREEKELRIINPHIGSRRYQGVGGDGEYITEMRNIESDVDCRRNAREYQETRKFVLELEELERLKMRGDGEAITRVNEDDKKLDRRRHDVVARVTKQKRSGDAAAMNEQSALIKESIDGSAKKFNGSAHLPKMDLHATKTRILESIDHMLGTMDDTKRENDAPVQQEETEQETIEKITRELQENGWQLLFNALTIHRNSTDTGKRTVRLECLNHIRQQLDKLYALESTLDNCPLKLQSLSNNEILYNEEHQQTQQLEHKIVDP